MSCSAKTMLLKLTILISCVVLVNCACPTIISRREWNAKSSLTDDALRENPPPFVVVHHSDTPVCSTTAACKSRVLNIQNYHMNHNGWKDIGYNFLIGGDGNVYEGRGWGKFGAHCPNYNGKSIGVCVIGDFMHELPTTAQLTALQNLIECGVEEGKIHKDYHLIGHRQGRSTSCPGDALFNKIKTWTHFDSSIKI